MWDPEDSASGFETAAGVLTTATSARPRPHANQHQSLPVNLTGLQPIASLGDENDAIPKLAPPPMVPRPQNFPNTDQQATLPYVSPGAAAQQQPTLPYISPGAAAASAATITPRLVSVAQTTAASTIVPPNRRAIAGEDDSSYMQTSSALAQYYPEPRAVTIESSRNVSTRHYGPNIVDGGVVSTPAGWPAFLAAPPMPSRRLVKQRDLPVYLAFSIVATILFFPTGFIALYYAVKLRRSFSEGVYANNLEEATRMAKNCEKCLLLTLVLAFVVGFLVFGLVDYYSAKRTSNDMIQRSTTPEMHTSFLWGGK